MKNYSLEIIVSSIFIIFTLCGLFILGLIVFDVASSNYKSRLEKDKISNSDYRNILYIAKDDPSSRPLIKEAMKDGRISKSEYEEIESFSTKQSILKIVD